MGGVRGSTPRDAKGYGPEKKVGEDVTTLVVVDAGRYWAIVLIGPLAGREPT